MSDKLSIKNMEAHINVREKSALRLSSSSETSSSDTCSTTDTIIRKEPFPSKKENVGNIGKKKKAMGDVVSNDDGTKSIIESTASLSVTADSYSQKQLNAPNMESKTFNVKKSRAARPNDIRRPRGFFYAGHGRRGLINNNKRVSIYPSQNGWRVQSSDGNTGTEFRRSASSNLDSSGYQARGNGITSATLISGATNQKTTSESCTTGSTKGKPSFRSPMTRIFHNGALRIGRTWHGNRSTLYLQKNASKSISPMTTTTKHEIDANDTSQVCDSERSDFSTRRFGANIPVRKTGRQMPIIYVAATGTIWILLNKGVMIEVAVDRAVRIICHDKFSALCNARGTSSYILHKHARIYQHEEEVFCNFGSHREKSAVFGTHGVLFTMSHLAEAYLVSSTALRGTISVPLGRLHFPNLDYDYTARMFFAESQTGSQFTVFCNELAQEARHNIRDDGTLTVSINGIYIKQQGNGDVELNCRPRHITCSPSAGTLRVRTNLVDMAVQDTDKAFIKKGSKRIHVSRSGMVVSDGNCITSMDHFGRIVS